MVVILGSVVCFEVGDGFAESWVDGLLKIGVEVGHFVCCRGGKDGVITVLQKGSGTQMGFVVRSEAMKCRDEIGKAVRLFGSGIVWRMVMAFCLTEWWI